jgi:hypothetical protein
MHPARALLLLTLPLAVVPARAQAAPLARTTARLEYTRGIGAESCLGEGGLRIEVARRSGYDPFTPDARARLVVTITKQRYQIVGTLQFFDETGAAGWHRSYPVRVDDCFTLVSAMGSEISYQFMPEPTAPEPPKPEPPPAPAEPAPAAPPPLICPELPPPAPIAPPLSSPSAPLPEGPRFQAGLASVFAIGAAPSVVGGIGGFIGVRWPRVSLALEGRALFAPSATIAGAKVRDGYRFDFAALSGTGCYHPAPWAFVCGRAEVGALSFANPGVKFNLDNMTLRVLGFGVRFGGDWTLTSWLAMRAYFEVLGAPSATRLGTEKGDLTFWSHPMAYGSVGFGPVFTFPGT